MENKSSLFTFFIVILPILAAYVSPFPGVNIAEFTLLCVFTIVFFGHLQQIDFGSIFRSSYFILFVCILMTTCLSSLFQANFSFFDVLQRITRFAFYVVCVLLLKGKFNAEFAFKCLNFFAAVASIYLILQVFTYYALNLILPWYIESIPLVSGDIYTSIDYGAFFKKLYRPCSLFLEPGYFAHYVLPAFVYVLFSETPKPKTRFLLSVLYITALIASTSGQAILIALGILAYWWLRRLTTSRAYHQLFFMFFITLMIILITPILVSNGTFQASLERLFDSPGASVNSRIYRGFVVYGMMDTVSKVIGVGYGNISCYVIANNIYTIYDITKNYDYMNSFCYMLVTGGILCSFMYLWVFYDWFKNTTSFYKIIVVVFFVISFVDTAFILPVSIFYLFFIYADYKKTNVVADCIPK